MYRRLKICVAIAGLFFTMLLQFTVAFAQDSSVTEQQQYWARERVEKYLSDKMSSQGFYRSESFGDLQVIVPREIQYLQELKKMRSEAVNMNDYYMSKQDSVLVVYDTLIAQQTREIAQKKIRNFYKIEHVFSLKEGKEYELYEGTFYLSANLFVKDLDITMDLKLDEDEYDWFYYFKSGYNLFSGGDVTANNELSQNIYYYFSHHFSQITEHKGEALLAMIVAVRTTKRENQYNPSKICQEVVKDFMYRRKTEFPAYLSEDFSDVKALMVNNGTKDTLAGYNLFHRFSVISTDNKDSTACLYFELDPWFMVTGTFTVEPPFEKYFEKD